MKNWLLNNRRHRLFVDHEYQMPHLRRSATICLLSVLLTGGFTLFADWLAELGNPDPGAYWVRLFGYMGAGLLIAFLAYFILVLRVSHRLFGSAPRLRKLVVEAQGFRRLSSEEFRVRSTDLDKWFYEFIEQALRTRNLRITAAMNVIRREIVEPLREIAGRVESPERERLEALVAPLEDEAPFIEAMERIRTGQTEPPESERESDRG